MKNVWKSGKFSACGTIFNEKVSNVGQLRWKNRAEDAKKIGWKFLVGFQLRVDFFAKIEGEKCSKKIIGATQNS